MKNLMKNKIKRKEMWSEIATMLGYKNDIFIYNYVMQSIKKKKKIVPFPQKIIISHQGRKE